MDSSLDHGRRRPRRSKEELEKERNEKMELEKKLLLAQAKRDSAFKVMSIDFHLEENGYNHHTGEYEKQDLVVRRGQVFILTIFMDCIRPFNPSSDKIVLKFETGNQPSESSGTRINVKWFPSVRDLRSWGFEILECQDKSLKVLVMTSPSSVVGEYKIIVKTYNEETGTVWVNVHNSPVYLLFNAWCEDDPVYMPDESERNEYVLNDNGMIWRHPESIWFKGSKWYFGQFDAVSLDCALYVLYELSKLSVHLMGNPALVSRSLSALVNNCDEDGILVGNWSGNYEDGERPTFWDGTVDILERYMIEYKPVQYGQCWVFSGVLTTLGRTLGIPTRSVTNFSSAHDTDGSVTIDRFIDKDGKPIDGSDSVWNFHVWNEVWMKRFDLPAGYDGWQAIDSTPQECSSGILITNAMCCGPCPIKAIKEGDLPIGNDTAFVYAEVNADVVYWMVTDDETRPVNYFRNDVGTSIITKKVGDEGHGPYGVDLKSEYKYPPGPEEDRVTQKAVLFGSKCKFVGEIYNTATVEDVSFKIILPELPVIGEDCSVRLRMKNESKETRMVKVGMEARVAFYTGMASYKPCKTLEDCITMSGMSESYVNLDLTAEDYIDFIVDAETVFKVYITAEVVETGQLFTSAKNMSFEGPPLQLECPRTLDKGDAFQVKVSFTNPLPRALEGVLNISGRLLVTRTIRHQTIPPKSSFTTDVKTHVKSSMRRYGWTTLQASFTSKQLTSSNYEWIYVQ